MNNSFEAREPVSQDYHERDEEFRQLASSWDRSDGYCVDSHAEILQRVLNELAQVQQREARLREALQNLVKRNEESCAGLKAWDSCWDEAKQALEEQS